MNLDVNPTKLIDTFYLVNTFNNRHHSTIKMKTINVKPITYVDFNKVDNKEDTKFNVGDHVSVSKYNNNFAKVYVPNWSEKVSVIQKVKNTVPWIYVKENLNG